MVNFFACLAFGFYFAALVFVGLVVIEGTNVDIPWLQGLGIVAACLLISFGIKRHARI